MVRCCAGLATVAVAVAVLTDFSQLDDASLESLKAEIDAELRARGSGSHSSRLGFRYPHKQTFATSDPAAAARFARDFLGGHVVITNTSHTCADGSLSGFTHIVNFQPTLDAPSGFSVHFVRNPHKPPGNESVPGTNINAMTLGERVEEWRAGFTRGFDQFVDTHLGLAYESLDPLIDVWTAARIPYICRTWCCSGEQCPYGKESNNTSFCEQGCYVEAPHGIIIEALCGLGGGQEAASRCLTKATPKVFDLCASD